MSDTVIGRVCFAPLDKAVRRDREYAASKIASSVNLANRVTQQDVLIKELVGALEILLGEAESFSVSGVYFSEPSMGHKGPDLARNALAAAKEQQS